MVGKILIYILNESEVQLLELFELVCLCISDTVLGVEKENEIKCLSFTNIKSFHFILKKEKSKHCIFPL